MPRPQKTDTKERILKLASEKFFRLGFSRVSIDELVAELRTSKSAVYKFFPSKEELVRSVLIDLNSHINKHIGLIVNDSNLEFPEKLEQIIKFTGSLLGRINKEFLEDLKTQTPKLWNDYLKMRSERLETLYMKLFEEGIKQHKVRNDIPVDFILFYYTQITEFVVNPEIIAITKYSPDESYNMISKLFLEGANP
ncbi:MAG: TetR/AcrR family transcriptional regulator [Melioribacteraceae bacterium]|nr:TetR/AcrR family transcriptional regulator [Melioribacteraceae bacterium]MCF8355127.1 TetR/AcrR family transcriptional regulator [Melioribacteraceae bacterium]MCF8392396.1 TetR/AcrR family transcriptional regulator [Melioribacteraceae bacterium]MCF8417917.1 TetR/AcrR family transcriptional regulator [Melioribacteraceae bacterium]